MSDRWFVARPLAFLFVVLSAFLTPAHAARDGSTDRPGLDYRSFELSAPNPDLCENACKSDEKCRSWTYSWPGAKGPKAMCALKTGVPPKRSDTCCISGVMSTSSPVTRTEDPKPQPPVDQAQPAPAPKPQESAKQDSSPTPAPKPAPDTGSGRVSVVPKPKPPVPQQREAAVEPGQDAVDEPQAKPGAAPQRNDKNADPELSPEKVAACRDYASRAIAQNEENRSLRCGLTGSRWGFSYDAYYNYCAKNPASAYQAARRGRDEELAACKSRIASRQNGEGDIITPEVNVDLGDLFDGRGRDERFCRTFAAQSVRQVDEARRLDCGFGGPRWSASRVRQARLCNDIGPRAATRLLNDRARELDRCRTEADGGFAGSAVGNCVAYAEESVRQARIARRLDCGYGGARWTSNYRAHLRWCRRVPFGEAAAELRLRDRYLARCE